MNGLAQKNGPTITDGYSLPSGYGLTMEVGNINYQHFYELDTARIDILVQVSAVYGQLDQILNWCHENLRHAWRWRMESMPSDMEKGRYEFWFEDDAEAEFFTLRWK